MTTGGATVDNDVDFARVRRRELLRLAQLEAVLRSTPRDEVIDHRLAAIEEMRRMWGVPDVAWPVESDSGRSFEDRQARRLAQLNDLERQAVARLRNGLPGTEGFLERIRICRMNVLMVRNPAESDDSE